MLQEGREFPPQELHPQAALQAIALSQQQASASPEHVNVEHNIAAQVNAASVPQVDGSQQHATSATPERVNGEQSVATAQVDVDAASEHGTSTTSTCASASLEDVELKIAHKDCSRSKDKDI